MRKKKGGGEETSDGNFKESERHLAAVPLQIAYFFPNPDREENGIREAKRERMRGSVKYLLRALTNLFFQSLGSAHVSTGYTRFTNASSGSKGGSQTLDLREN